MDQRAKRDAAMTALLRPDWAGVEEASGLRVPPRLRAVYADAAVVTLLDLLVQDPARTPPDGEWSLDCFLPATADALIPHGPRDDLGASFCFALSYRGDPYGVLLTEDGLGGPVWRYAFDGSETLVAPSLDAFLNWPRRRRPVGYEPHAG